MSCVGWEVTMLFFKVTLFQQFSGVQGKHLILGDRQTGWRGAVQDISRQLRTFFNHVLKEANILTNGLARKGVSHSSFTFYV